MELTAMWYYLLIEGIESAIFLLVVGCIAVLWWSEQMDSLEMGSKGTSTKSGNLIENACKGSSSEAGDFMENGVKGTSSETGDSMEKGANGLEVIQTQLNDEIAEGSMEKGAKGLEEVQKQSKDDSAQWAKLPEASCSRLELLMALNFIQFITTIAYTPVLWFLEHTPSYQDSLKAVTMIFCFAGANLLGYFAVRMLKAINLESCWWWMGGSLIMGCFSSVLSFAISAFLEYRPPVAAYWVIVTIPFTFLGGYLGSKPKPREKPLPAKLILKLKATEFKEMLKRIFTSERGIEPVWSDGVLEDIFDIQGYPSLAHAFMAGYLSYSISNHQVIAAFYGFQSGNAHSMCRFRLSPAIVLVMIFFADISATLNCLLFCARFGWWWGVTSASIITCMYMIFKSVMFLSLVELMNIKCNRVGKLLAFVKSSRWALIKSLAIMVATSAIWLLCALFFVTGLLSFHDHLQAFRHLFGNQH